MLPELGPDVVWDNSQLLTSGVVSVVAGVQGDFNGNGVVDAADFTVWRDSLGAAGAGLAADGNADLHVDLVDFELWRSNFGATSSAAVPEPSSPLLVLLAVYGVAARRK